MTSDDFKEALSKVDFGSSQSKGVENLADALRISMLTIQELIDSVRILRSDLEDARARIVALEDEAS